MNVINGFILGLVQGLTEFLPISSSGHLVIAQKLLGFTSPPVTFDILVQAATLISVFVYFRQKIFHLSRQQMWFLVIGTLPAIVAGLLLEPFLEFMFDSMWLLVGGFIVTGVLMVWTKHIPPADQPLSTKKALVIGSYQALAILPSVSRSGSTVFGALKSGLSVVDAFSYSFLLSIPAIGGASVLTVLKAESLQFTPGDWVGFIAAAISGFFAIKLLDTLMKNRQLHVFGYYCLMLAAVLMIVWR